MSLTLGARLGPYEITAKLGEGGMGVVFKAKDFHLGRDVALKFLPEGFTQDPERLARFEREAKLLAQLNHPNIAQIYGLEVSGDTRALVMELVDGPTLAERLEAGPLPFNESLSVSLQIAQALEEAHEKGIVHRDLKPQNVKASIEGKVKVLDFGLAKAMDPMRAASGGASASQLAQSPTLTLGATQLGVILGTAAYMSPEQAKGMAVDKRADIWAFGVVLWEMLTGRRLFGGDSVTETLASVLRNEVDFAALPAETPAALRTLLRRCLERNPKNRLHDIADARVVLAEVAAGRSDEAPPALAPIDPAGADRRSRRRALAAVALVAAGAVGGWFVSKRASVGVAPSASILRPTFRQLTKMPGGEGDPTLAPDGESFVFVKRDGDDLDLFVQRVDGTKAVPLTAECALDDYDPAFSADGRLLAYRSECGGGGVFVMGATGEANRRVVDFGYQPAWSPDGRELALVTERLDAPTSRNSESQLWAVRVDSGERRRVTEHDAMAPAWSPDGRRIAFWGLRESRFQRDLWSVAADGSELAESAAVALLDDLALDWAPVYSGDGRWLYFASTRGGTFNLWRLAIDPASGARRGEPEPLTAPSSWAGPFALSADGRRLVFADRNIETEIVLAPFDPARRELAADPAHAFSGSFELREQKLSPDGEWILFVNEDPPQQLHLVRRDGTGYRQLIADEERNRQGEWSPAGDWIVFQTTRGDSSLAIIRPDGGGWQALPIGSGASTPRWSPDGTTIAAFDNNRNGLLIDVRAGFGAPVVTEMPPIAAGVLFWPTTWSSDGALLAGRATRAGQIENIVIRAMATGAYRELPGTSGAHADFSMAFVGARDIAYTDDAALWLRGADGGVAKRLHAPVRGRRVGNISATADGHWLTWIEKADESDIWLMTLEEAVYGEKGQTN